jgi:pimeloyl-ACP methyl ester carboxylesterase
LTVLGATSAAVADDGPPGSLIDVGGYRLHISCEGYGTPAVIFDVGLGGTSREWRAVADEVRRFTRVCIYDRAGYGWSDLGPLPRTSSRIANELFLLLDGADIEGPYVLAGHSYGGYNMQLFARRYPYLVAGIVLVDSSHPQQVERFLEPPIEMNTAPSTSWGIVQFGPPPKPHEKLSAEAKDSYEARISRWKTRRTLANELLGFRDSARELREARPPAPIPTIVISRGRRVWPKTEKGDLLEGLWADLQSELAAQSPWSAHILAISSGHHVHLDQPQIVAYSMAVITDLFRVAARGDRHSERQELSGRSSIDFHAASWLSDSLIVNGAGHSDFGEVPGTAMH